jgi:hypothetical protein
MLKIILVTILVSSYLFYKWYGDKKKKQAQYSLNAYIKANFNKLTVNSGEIEILDRSYFSEVESTGYSMAHSADALYDPTRNVKTVRKWVSVLVYNDFIHRGKKFRLNSISIDMDKEAIKKIISSKVSSIDIYFDSNNPENHYFDLQFLS